MINGVKQTPMEGASLVYSFGDAKAPERRTTQYFEMLCNRGIYHEGWMASTSPMRLPWAKVQPGAAGLFGPGQHFLRQRGCVQHERCHR
jgi:arylsulfatase A-like enzyme